MRTLCYEAYSTLQWLEALGLEFEPGIRRVLGGVYPRTHMPLRGAGEAYLSALRSALRSFGVPIVCNAEVTALRKSGEARRRARGRRLLSEHGDDAALCAGPLRRSPRP